MASSTDVGGLVVRRRSDCLRFTINDRTESFMFAIASPIARLQEHTNT